MKFNFQDGCEETTGLIVSLDACTASDGLGMRSQRAAGRVPPRRPAFSCRGSGLGTRYFPNGQLDDTKGFGRALPGVTEVTDCCRYRWSLGHHCHGASHRRAEPLDGTTTVRRLVATVPCGEGVAGTEASPAPTATHTVTLTVRRLTPGAGGRAAARPASPGAGVHVHVLGSYGAVPTHPSLLARDGT